MFSGCDFEDSSGLLQANWMEPSLRRLDLAWKDTHFINQMFTHRFAAPRLSWDQRP